MDVMLIVDSIAFIMREAVRRPSSIALQCRTHPMHFRCVLSRRVVPLAAAGVIACLGATGLTAQSAKAERPKLGLRAQPSVAVAPARVVLTAELQGGSDDFEEYYCPTIEWQWGDDTTSESTNDCEPFEAGKSQIRRRYSVQHVYRRNGSFRVYFHMKRNGKILGSASTVIQVQPGLDSGPF
jgi:hypothetical protein